MHIAGSIHQRFYDTLISACTGSSSNFFFLKTYKKKFPSLLLLLLAAKWIIEKAGSRIFKTKGTNVE